MTQIRTTLASATLMFFAVACGDSGVDRSASPEAAPEAELGTASESSFSGGPDDAPFDREGSAVPEPTEGLSTQDDPNGSAADTREQSSSDDDLLEEGGGSDGANDAIDDNASDDNKPVDDPDVERPACDQEFYVPGGSGCLTNVEGLDVKFFPMEKDINNADRDAVRLAVYLHGDGAAEWEGLGIIRDLVSWARDNDVLLIAPLAPGIDDEGRARWWLKPETSVDALSGVMERFVQSYNLPSQGVLYTGISGGSQFLTNEWLHRAGHLYPGALAHNCGGTTPDGNYPFAWDTSDPVARDMALFFNYGSEDFLAPQSEKAIDYWTSQGLEVDSTVHEGASHCAHPIVDPTIAFWEEALASLR